ncbi:MAG TPA: DUF998 domain-containing protein [Micromonosporaceae bacterium]
MSAGLAPIVMTTGWLIAAAVQPVTYSPMRETISALAGHGGRDRWIVTGALVVVGVAYIANGFGLSALARPARVGLVISGVAAIGIASCPEPVTGTTGQHLACVSVGAASIAIWPLLTVQRSPACALTSASCAVPVGVVFLVMLGWLVVQAHSGGTMLGLVERLDSSLQMMWPFAVAVGLRQSSVWRAWVEASESNGFAIAQPVPTRDRNS